MKKWIIYFVLSGIAFAWGAIAVKYQIFPYKVLSQLKNTVIPPQKVVMTPFGNMFVEDLIDPKELMYGPVNDMADLRRKVSQFVRPLTPFEELFEGINIHSLELDNHIAKMVYSYHELIDTAYAYFKPSSEVNDAGALIIPGSGNNQSTIMYKSEDRNYQSNGDDIIIPFSDVFILVKPNQDFLAIHDGKKKIDESTFVNYILHNGGSYSHYYLMQSLAFVKYIKTEYSQSVVCGISQGGLATLITAIYSKPDFAIVASGFSVYMDYPFPSGHDQIIIPGYTILHNTDSIVSMLNEETQYLFTWGLKEPTWYGVDAKERASIDALKNLRHVRTSVHQKAHVYDQQAIIEFLSKD